MKKLYSRSDGYLPGYCFAYFAQGIEAKIANRMPVHWSASYSNQPLEINVTDLEVLKINWKEIIGNFTSTVAQLVTFGFKSINSGVKLILALKRKDVDPDTGYFSAKVYACEWKFYNTVCPYLDENTIIDVETISYNVVENLDANVLEILGNYADDVPLSYFSTEGEYTTSVESSPLISLENCPEYKSVYFSGNAVPKKLYPKGFYDHNEEQAEMLPVLKSALLLHNLTIVASANGDLWMKNKDSSSNTTVSIMEKDIIEFDVKRRDWEAPDTSVLEILMGDTKPLQEITTEHFSAYLAFKWELTAVIDRLTYYEIQLFDTLAIRGREYNVSELHRDPIKDECEIVAWRVNV